VTAGREDGTAGAMGRLRASHADREQAIDLLKAAFGQGRLAKDEFDVRVGQVFTSRTYADGRIDRRHPRLGDQRPALGRARP
jgi:hypothetical protein